MNLKEKQDKEFDEIFPSQKGESGGLYFTMYDIKQLKEFLDKVRKETCKAKDKEYGNFANRMNTALFEAEKLGQRSEREKILKIIDEVIGYGDTVEGGVAEGVLILIKSKIIKELK